MTKTLITSLLLCVAMGGAALAQTTLAPSAPATSTDTQSSGTAASSPSGIAPPSAVSMDQSQSQGGFYTYQEGNQMLGSGLMGARVTGADNEEIGEVNELLLDRDGQVMAVVVGVGGFLGIGKKDVAIANDQLKFVLSRDAAANGTGTTTVPGATTSPATGANTAAGTAPATDTTAATGTAGAPGMATTPGGAATGTTRATSMGVTRASDPANGSATGMMGNGWGWSGAGIDHIQVAFTREQLESAPAFETAE